MLVLATRISGASKTEMLKPYHIRQYNPLSCDISLHSTEYDLLATTGPLLTADFISVGIMRLFNHLALQGYSICHVEIRVTCDVTRDA